MLNLLRLNGVSHRGQYLPDTGIWLAAVCHQHVVEHQDVASLPSDLDGLGVVSCADLLERRLLDWRPIAIVGVMRQSRLRELREQGFAKWTRQSRGVKECSMIEPNGGTGARMLCNRLTHASCAQPAFIFPLERIPGLPTLCVEGLAIGRVEHLTPLETNALAEVAHVEDTFGCESLACVVRNAREHATTIGDRSLSAAISGAHAAEE